MSKSKSLFTTTPIGTVVLTDGETTIEIPKLDMKKTLRIVKFLGVDGTKIYNDVRDILLNDELGSFERIATVVEGLEEEQLFQVIAIVLDLPVEEALKLDLNETLDVLIVLSENTNLKKTYKQIQVLSKVTFGLNLPDLQNVIDQRLSTSNARESEEIAKAETSA